MKSLYFKSFFLLILNKPLTYNIGNEKEKIYI